MTTHTLAQTLTSVRQTIRTYAWRFMLSLVLGVAALAAYRSTTVPAVSVPEVRSVRTLATRLDPAQQSVIDYLRAHSAIHSNPAAVVTVEPAQQSVLNYLRAHAAVETIPASGVLLDPVVQSVLDYLRVHSAVETQPLDPTQQSVIDYLRAHHW